MLKKTLQRTLLATAAAALLGFGLTTPGHAETTQKYTTFTWNGYTFKIPVIQKTQTPTPTQTATQTQPTQTSTPTSTATVVTEVQQVVDLVNAERAKAGLAPLKVNTSLANVAKVKAEEMRDKKYFSHTSPTYGSPFDMMKSFGIKYSYAGENIAAGQKTPADVMKAWMNSAGHKANILNKNFTEIGVGLAKGGSYGTYWVQEFIKP